MYFTGAELSNFRNYEHETIDFHRKVNVILGKNAQGKTNLLEALYMTSFGKSFRHARDTDMIRIGTKYAGIKAGFVRDSLEMTVEIGLIRGGKSIRVDGVNLKKTSQLLNTIHIVLFSPDDLRIVKDEPAKRRRFIDRELCQVSAVYYSELSGYQRALQQRNAVLRSERPDSGILDIWDLELAKYGASVTARRDAFIRGLSEVSAEIHRDLTDGREQLRTVYSPSVPLTGSPSEQREHLLEVFRENRQNDLERRTTGRGPHRDDLSMYIDDLEVRKFGSQGQQRTAALSLKLAEISMIRRETGDEPVLLLDDVLSELDQTRQRQLMSSFSDIQIFLTSTEMDREMSRKIPDHTVFYVENGSVSPGKY